MIPTWEIIIDVEFGIWKVVGMVVGAGKRCLGVLVGGWLGEVGGADEFLAIILMIQDSRISSKKIFSTGARLSGIVVYMVYYANHIMWCVNMRSG